MQDHTAKLGFVYNLRLKKAINLQDGTFAETFLFEDDRLPGF